MADTDESWKASLHRALDQRDEAWSRVKTAETIIMLLLRRLGPGPIRIPKADLVSEMTSRDELAVTEDAESFTCVVLRAGARPD